MYILDATGEVLELSLSIVKIDVLLGDDFIYKVQESDDLATIVDYYKERFNVKIRSHDISRARQLKPILEYYQKGGIYSCSIDYFMDTLAVILVWCLKFRRVYVGRYYREAFQDFYASSKSINARSIVGVDPSVLESMFTYVFCREHLGRHPGLNAPYIPG